MRPRTILVLASFLLVAFDRSAHATLLEFWNDAAGWQRAVQNYTFIDFTGFPNGTQITDQYPGIVFTSWSFIHHSTGYVDEWGLHNPDGVMLHFDIPLHALAVDHLGVVQFALYYQGKHIQTSSEFDYPWPGAPFFSGIISDLPFDEVYMFRPQPPFPNNIIPLDNLYYGLPIPAPGALPLLALAILSARRRRRA